MKNQFLDKALVGKTDALQRTASVGLESEAPKAASKASAEPAAQRAPKRPVRVSHG